MKPSEQLDHADSTLNKLDELLQPLTVNIVGQDTSTIDLQRIMDEGKMLLVKLSVQYQSVSNLIGSILIALFLNAAYARQANKRRQCNLYADEFQRFATEDFATLLTEARKFGIATTIAHQALRWLREAGAGTQPVDAFVALATGTQAGCGNEGCYEPTASRCSEAASARRTRAGGCCNDSQRGGPSRFSAVPHVCGARGRDQQRRGK